MEVMTGTQDGWNLDLGADPEAIEECCLMAYLIEPRTTRPEVVPSTIGWVFLLQSLNKEIP